MLSTKQQICDFVDSLITLKISNNNIEDLKNLLPVVTNLEHTECS